MNHIAASIAARMAPWVLRRLDASWALRLLREGAARLGQADDGALADALLLDVMRTLGPHAKRAGWRP
jgi:hypothetical protein